MEDFLSWTDAHPGMAAWAQAIATFVAVLVALYVPMRERRIEQRSGREQQVRDAKEQIRRIVAGLTAEIDAAVEASGRQQHAIDAMLSNLEMAKKSGAEIRDFGPLRAGTMAITEATIYHTVGADLGRLPPELISEITGFYSYAREMERIAEVGTSAVSAFETISELAPRVRIHGAILTAKLRKFERNGYADSTNLALSLDEIKALANQVGYPIEKLAKERGVAL